MNAASLDIRAGVAHGPAIARARGVRAYWTEARYESVRMLRAPGFSIPFLGLPVLLYLLFAVLIAGAAAKNEPGVAQFLVMAMFFAAIVMATMLAAALTLGHLALSAGQVLSVALIGILGSVPFCALGFLIGVWTTARSAPAFVNLVYLPMLHLSGLFYPLPKALKAMAPFWPAYHVQRLVFGVVGLPTEGGAMTHIAVLAGVTVLCGVLATRRLAKVG